MKTYKDLLILNLQEESEKNKGKVLSKTPFPHQMEAHKKMSIIFSNSGNRGLLVLPTGAGKTYTSVYWILKFVVSKKKKVLWLADQGFLLEQAREAFRENILLLNQGQRTEINIRLVSGSSNHANTNTISITDDILLMTSQTAISCWESKDKDDNGNIIESNFEKFVTSNASKDELFIVYDEAQHTPAYERRNLLIGGTEGKTGICEKYKSVNLLGLTATPTYTDKGKRGWLWKIFKDEIIFEARKKELEDAKILAIPNFMPERTSFAPLLSDKDVENIIIKHQELPSRIIEEIAKNEERNRFIAQLYCDKRHFYGKTIMFVDRWYQCKTIEKYINEKAGKTIAASVFSYIDTNRNIDYINSRSNNQNDINLDKFKTGELEVLLNVKMLTEGVDVPDVKSVFITRETNSTILFTQMIGRALRGEKAGGKKDTANIVLFIDNWNRHVEFASARTSGGIIDEVKERGYRPMELINIDLIDKLDLEYAKQEFKISFMDMLPLGWYVVSYSDAVDEENEQGDSEKTIQDFNENVLIYKNEKNGFINFINNYETKHYSTAWEKQELPLETTDIILNNLLKEYFHDLELTNTTALKGKLRQVARHLGQKKYEPKFYTFEQREDLDLRKYVILIRNEAYGLDKAEEYLKNVFLSTSNPMFKVVFPDFDSFYRAYKLEDEVYRKSKKQKVEISDSARTFFPPRLLHEEIRKQVFARDENICLCCGKNSNLQADHIMSHKHNEPKDDNPELYQTLCGTCNRLKLANEFNFKITNYKDNKIQIRDVNLASNSEDPKYYLARLINCYFATNAVQKSSVKAINNGNAIWKVKLKTSDIKLDDFLLRDKNKLIDIIKNKGFNLKDLKINLG